MRMVTLNELGLVAGGLLARPGSPGKTGGSKGGSSPDLLAPYGGRGGGGAYGGGYGFLGDIYNGGSYQSFAYVNFPQQDVMVPATPDEILTIEPKQGTQPQQAFLSDAQMDDIAEGTVDITNGAIDIGEGVTAIMESDGILSVQGVGDILVGVVDVGKGVLDLKHAAGGNAVGSGPADLRDGARGADTAVA